MFHFLLDVFIFYLFYNVQSRLHFVIRMEIYIDLHKNIKKVKKKIVEKR